MSSSARFDVPPKAALAGATLLTALVLAVSLFTIPVGRPARIAAVAVGTVAQFVVSYVSLYRPYSKLRRDHRVQLMGVLFEGLRREYRKQAGTDAEPRVNVMQVERQFAEGILPRRERQLRIAFHTDGYGREEVGQRYAPGEGCWGRAYVENDPTYYDERRQPLGERQMSATQRRVTEDVKSVLSVPVYRPGRSDDEIIAVLNLDSSRNVERTKFDKKAVQRTAMRWSTLAGHVLA